MCASGSMANCEASEPIRVTSPGLQSGCLGCRLIQEGNEATFVQLNPIFFPCIRNKTTGSLPFADLLGRRSWTTATMLLAFCNWYILRELLRHIVSSSTGVKMDASANGDHLDEFLVQVLDGSVKSVRLREGFSESIRNNLQEFLNRQVSLFHLPHNNGHGTEVDS